MEYRPYYLAREWTRLGHQVSIIASACSHVRASSPQLGRHDRLDETIDGIRYCWLQTPAYTGNGLRRAVNMLAFVWRLAREAKRLSDACKPDLVIASSTYPLDIWPARHIARLSKAKLVFEVHDLWPLTPMELGGMSRWHPFIVLLQAAEDYACRHADVVISILPKVRQHLEGRGMAAHKLHIVPNGIDLDEWQDEAPVLPAQVHATLDGLRAQGWFIVGYAGTHGLANALDTLLDAAQMMQSEKIAFVLVGAGPLKARLQLRGRSGQLQNVYFIDAVLKTQVPALLQYFDIAYIGWQKQALYRFGISPNKLMDYMMAARPVLHSVEAGNDAVGDAGCGLSVAPEDPRAVVQAIRALQGCGERERSLMGQRGRAFVMAHLSYPVLGRRFLNACG